MVKVQIAVPTVPWGMAPLNPLRIVPEALRVMIRNSGLCPDVTAVASMTHVIVYCVDGETGMFLTTADC